MGTPNPTDEHFALTTLSDHHHDYKNNRFLYIVSCNETHHDFVEPVTYFMFHGCKKCGDEPVPY
ncbi:hypothetical protein BBB57_19965 [Kosakonia sacchari]|uniref:hypothetical protein n=1 Tax=Kosakonia sacchari TaxID=1158459 RepID=UPI0008073755|nr:hypothetical protein [Kosakonia sacchari]ANR80323.1 hypothetical protein BBB57_19965 [Kosakonia sacchari]